jgi:biopolymer transport protein ExbB
MNLNNIADGGIIGYLLIIMGISAIAIIVERILSLRKERSELSKLNKIITEKLEAKDYRSALEESRKFKGVAARVFFDLLNKNSDKKAVLKLKLEESAAIEVPHLWKNLNVLSIIVSIAPLLGLLGTVLGMLQSFEQIEILSQLASGGYGPGVVAGGIKKALVTTILGLMVAIPVNVAYSYLMGMVEKITLEMESISYDIIDSISENKENSK